MKSLIEGNREAGCACLEISMRGLVKKQAVPTPPQHKAPVLDGPGGLGGPAAHRPAPAKVTLPF